MVLKALSITQVQPEQGITAISHREQTLLTAGLSSGQKSSGYLRDNEKVY